MAHVSAKPRPMMAPPGVRHSAAAARTPSRRDEGTIGKYRVTKTIGKGNFAKVKLARHVPTGREVAIKIVDKTQLNASSLQKMLREVRIMKTLDHPNIVKLIEVIETDRHMYLVLEYCSGGELFDYIVKHGKLKEQDARVKFRQVLSAVEYLHQKHIVHRDLKAENLLLDGELNVKLADFGFSNEFLTGRKLDTFCGSPPYAAPELFQGKKYDGPEVDVWSVGVILYILICGCLPFDGSNLKELRERVLKGKYRVPFYMSTDCETLLKKFLSMNPAKRTSLQAALREKWINVDSEDMKAYVEPKRDLIDSARVDTLATMGYSRQDIEDSLKLNKFDEIQGTYTLLAFMARRPSAVSGVAQQQRKAPMSTFSQLIEQSASVPKDDVLAGSSGSGVKEDFLHTGGSVRTDSHLSAVDEHSPGAPADDDEPGTPGVEPLTPTTPTTPTDIPGDVGEQTVILTLAEENNEATPVKVKKKKKKSRTRSSDDVTTDSPQQVEDNGVGEAEDPESAAAQVSPHGEESVKASKKVSHKKSVKSAKLATAPLDVTPAANLDLALTAAIDPDTPHREASIDPAAKVKVKSKSHVQRHATVGSGDTKHKAPANDRLSFAPNEPLISQKQAAAANEPSSTNQKQSSPLTNQKQSSPVKVEATNHVKRAIKDDFIQSEAAENPYFARGQGGRNTFHGSAAPSRPLTSQPSHDSTGQSTSLLNKFVAKFQKNGLPQAAAPDDGVRPRSVHVLTADVLSSQDGDTMLAELRRALAACQVRCEVAGSKYVLVCAYTDKSQTVQWEAEVCRLPLRATNAIRYKKIAGASSLFKTVTTRLSSEMKL